MNVKQISSLTNETVKEIRALHLRKYREKSGLFLAEGLKIILSAVEQGHKIKSLLYENKMAGHAHMPRLLQGLLPEGECLEVTAAILEKISARDNPQSVVAVFYENYAPLQKVRDGLWVALEEVHDPGNLGTIMRTCDAVGAEGVILIGKTCDAFSLESVRATMGSIFNQKIVRADLSEFLQWRDGYRGAVIGTHLKATDDYAALSYKKPMILAMGSEQKGMSDAMTSVCDALVKIPMRGHADSLNLAVATGVMLYKIQG